MPRLPRPAPARRICIRPRAQAAAELRGLGGLVLEQALVDRTAPPVPSLVEWTMRLAGELDVTPLVRRPTTNVELLRAIVTISRTAADGQPALSAAA